MVAAFCQQPAGSSEATELAMRSKPRHDLLEFVAEHLTDAATTGDLAAQPAHASWLFSLLITAAKTAQLFSSDRDGTLSSGQLVAVTYYHTARNLCTLTAQLARQCSGAESSSSSSTTTRSSGPLGSPTKKTGKSKLSQASSTGGGNDGDGNSKISSSDSMMWPALAARCVFMMCQQLLCAAAAEGVSCTAALQQHSSSSSTTVAAAGNPSRLHNPQQMMLSLATATSCLGELLQGLPTEQAATKVAREVDGSATVKASRMPASAPAGIAAKPAPTSVMSSTISKLLEQYTQLQPALVAAAAAAPAVCSFCTVSCDGSCALGRAGHMLGQELLAKVKAFAGQAFAALPLLICCGNPACLNLGKRSETVLASGARGICKRCRAVRYCSKECQLAAWPLHMGVCKRLQKAAASEE